MRIAGFNWDDGNWPKCARHGVSREDIESALSTGPAIHPDVAHSVAEERFLAIGRTGAGRHLLIAFTLRRRDGETLIRPISARYMHSKEVRHYERQTQADSTAGQR
jgi:uncharacterized DUF497 family protein